MKNPEEGWGVVRAGGKECREEEQEEAITSYLLMTTVKALEIFVTSYRWQPRVEEASGRQPNSYRYKVQHFFTLARKLHALPHPVFTLSRLASPHLYVFCGQRHPNTFCPFPYSIFIFYLEYTSLSTVTFLEKNFPAVSSLQTDLSHPINTII